MTVQVQVGPPQIAIHQGETMLIIEEAGQINWKGSAHWPRPGASTERANQRAIDLERPFPGDEGCSVVGFRSSLGISARYD